MNDRPTELMELARQYAHAYYNHHTGTASVQQLERFRQRLESALLASAPIEAAQTSADRLALAKDIKDAIRDLSDGHHYPDLLDAVDALASAAPAAATVPDEHKLGNPAFPVFSTPTEGGELPAPSAQGPAELWLQLHGDCFDAELDEPVDYTSDEVTWCWHQINSSDVRYVRADLARPTPAAAAGVPQAWQPIETAPKDGLPVRLFAEGLISEDFNPGGSVEGQWCDELGWIGAVWNAEQDVWDTNEIVPTHWMPMPAPPTPDAAATACPHSRTKYLGMMMSKREAKFCLDCRETFYIDSGAPAGAPTKNHGGRDE